MSKKRVVTSYEKISDSLKELVKNIYATKGSSSLIKLDMYAEPTYAIVLETNEISYLVKISKQLKAYFDKVLLKYNPELEDEELNNDYDDDSSTDINLSNIDDIDESNLNYAS
ncbi:MAG: hypothetical protein Kow0079_13340 [Vicingaceae bacterium]